MCLMVYVGTQEPPMNGDPSVIGFDEIDESRALVEQWFSLPRVRHLAVPSGNCSCAVRPVLAEEPIEWYRGMWDGRSADECVVDVAIVNALRNLLAGGEIEIYALWAGNEAREPRWRVTRDAAWLDLERFFVQEDMFYRVTAS